MKPAKRIHKTMTAWVAIVAMLCHALMPSIAHARTSASSSLMIRLCTVSGSKLVALDDGKPAQSPTKELHAHPCLLCCSGSHVALPLAPLPALTVADLPKARSLPGISTPRVKSRQFAAAPPRGPPFVS